MRGDQAASSHAAQSGVPVCLRRARRTCKMSFGAAAAGGAKSASDELLFYVNGRRVVEENADPEQMTLSYLRKRRILFYRMCSGFHYSANACLLPLCSLYGCAVITVEGVGSSKTRIHPVQERIAKSHGSQCGFCTPGMVMSIYALLRNETEPSTEQIAEALAGNLCRCTGYRPIIDGCKTFCRICTTLFSAEEFQPLDPTQELIFPPELLRMAECQTAQTLVFRGERTTWISPVNLKELLELKAKYPLAPLVVGNTCVGPEMKLKDVFHPVIISPTRILDLHVVKHIEEGLLLGAACSLTLVKDVLTDAVLKLPAEKTKIFHALLQQLKTLAGQQIRNVASFGGNIISRSPTSDINPVLAVGNCILNVASQRRMRRIPVSDLFADGLGNNTLEPEETVVSVHIPHSSKGEFVSAFRQAHRRENALPIVNAGMRVLFEDDRDTVKDIGIFYGGMGATTLAAKQTCRALIGRSWNEELLGEACRSVLTEICLPSSAPGGKVEYRRTLVVSFMFRFYLEVLRSLKITDVAPGQLAEDPVGRPITHQAGLRHATGEALYCDDIRAVDEELFLVLVTSPKAHAKIVSIDASEALKMPGVVDVVSVQDVPATNEFYNYDVPDIIFAREKVTCVGQIVCAVVAESEVHAKRAAAKVNIRYEPEEPVILTIEEAIEHNSFFEPFRKLEDGDVDKAFKTVDHVLEGEILIGGQRHFYMETQSILAVPKGEDREMDIYASTQHPALVQDLVASCLGVPSNRIMCHVKRIGGAFGGKLMKTSMLACVTALAAKKTGRPVRCVLDRGTDMLVCGGRHPAVGKYKIGFMNNGRILAMDVNAYINGGCTPDDSILVREINMYKESGLTPYKQEFKAQNLLRCWKECMEKSAYHARRAAVNEFNQQNYWKKKGIAIIPMKFPVGFCTRVLGQAAALVHLYTDGSVLLTYGGVEMGQGLHTKMIQVASRELKMPMSNIHFCETSTTTVPNACASVGSMGTDVNGMAVKDACQTLLKRLEPVISQNPNGSWKEWAKEAFEQSINLSATGFFRGYEANLDWEKGEGLPFEYFIFGAVCTEVEIDCLSGDRKNVTTDIVMDIGCSINPAVDIGQIEGAFVQGLGLYTMEEIEYSPEGVPYTRGPDQYKIPAVCDIPEHFSVSLLASSESTPAIYSSKGLGESGLFLGCSAFFALWDAVAAARRERGLPGDFGLNSPLTPERIRMACADQFTEMIPRDEKPAPPWSVSL
ncbi:UNVERIFIED_CONTAM: hypothetical protein K2H54_048750 [Gekko kuhli]